MKNCNGCGMEIEGIFPEDDTPELCEICEQAWHEYEERAYEEMVQRYYELRIREEDND